MRGKWVRSCVYASCERRPPCVRTSSSHESRSCTMARYHDTRRSQYTAGEHRRRLQPKGPHETHTRFRSTLNAHEYGFAGGQREPNLNAGRFARRRARMMTQARFRCLTLTFLLSRGRLPVPRRRRKRRRRRMLLLIVTTLLLQHVGHHRVARDQIRHPL